MEIQLQLGGPDGTEKTVSSLQDWLRKERIAGAKIETKYGAPRPGEMGLEPSTILSVILGAQAMVELVKSIHVWIQARKPKAIVTVEIEGDGAGAKKKVTIDAENLLDQESFVENVLSSLGIKPS